ncbi:MAG: hypothetical protein JSV19_02295 [Phycisphaerales bacterium]|nr:MAG: hypothetical protein JSV19_02295 [Phycisphaerales bacterium]
MKRNAPTPARKPNRTAPVRKRPIAAVALGVRDKPTINVMTFKDDAGRDAVKSRYQVSSLFMETKSKVARGIDPDTMLDRQRSVLQRELSGRA